MCSTLVPEKCPSHTNPECRCSDGRRGAVKRVWSREAKERARQTDQGEAGRRKKRAESWWLRDLPFISPGRRAGWRPGALHRTPGPPPVALETCGFAEPKQYDDRKKLPIFLFVNEEFVFSLLPMKNPALCIFIICIYVLWQNCCWFYSHKILLFAKTSLSPPSGYYSPFWDL